MWNIWYIFFGLVAAVIGCVAWRAIKIKKAGSPYAYYVDTGKQEAGAIVCGIIAGGVLLVCLIAPVCAKKEIVMYQYTREYAIQSIESGSDFENISITEQILKMNAWLAEAKSNQAVYGMWSVYNIPRISEQIEELEPIVLHQEGGN